MKFNIYPPSGRRGKASAGTFVKIVYNISPGCFAPTGTAVNVATHLSAGP